MTTRDSFSVAVFGIPDFERQVLDRIFGISSSRTLSYRLAEPGTESAADILLVDRDNAGAVAEYRRVCEAAARLAWVLGPWALLYHLWALSLFLGKLGIWNLGQSLSEHEGTNDEAPSRSTYGWINWLLFNTGYHNEHHTFPNVAWTRLPMLARTAPEVFTARAEKSYIGYWLDHVRGDFTASRRTPMHDLDNSERCAGAARKRCSET